MVGDNHLIGLYFLVQIQKKRKRKLDEKKDEALVSIGSGYPIDSDLWIDS